MAQCIPWSLDKSILNPQTAFESCENQPKCPHKVSLKQSHTHLPAPQCPRPHQYSTKGPGVNPSR